MIDAPLAKRRLERARRRPRNRARSEAYQKNLLMGMLLAQFQRAKAKTSKYDPAECHRDGKR